MHKQVKTNKTGIVTFHRADNYGAVLQAYATVAYLMSRGIDAEIVDYRCPPMEQSYKLFRYDSKRGFVSNAKNFVHNIFRIGRRRRFKAFRSHFLKKGKKYSPKTIRGANNVYSVFITGSDQVWNDVCSLKDPAYCLSFVKEESKMVAYSASFGYDQVEPDRENFYRTQLQRFDQISVREQSGVKIVEKLLGKDATLLVDPTMMLAKEEWNTIAKEPNKKDYILIYLLNARDELLYFAKELALKTGCQIVNITDENNQIIEAEYVHNAGPLEFLGYFKNAKYVITNSFHGLMFSIIYRKSMYVDVPKGNKTTYSRLTHILGLLGIKGRFVSDFADSGNEPTMLDYTKIEARIREEQDKVKHFFDKVYQEEGENNA